MKRTLTFVATLTIALLAILNNAQAQELEFEVTINTPKNQIVDPKVFLDMKNQIESFVNGRKWTSDIFEQTERIKGNIQLTITEELSATSFQAEIAIQSVRPVYGSTIETALLTHNDAFAFTYEQFQPLEFADNLYNDHLTSVLSFYMYLVLGLDYDSFEPLGGDIYFQLAQNIINTIPSSVASSNPGWRPKDGNRTRFTLLDNLLSPRAKEFRYAMYDYHVRGLDLMSKSIDLGRANIMKAMEGVQKVGKQIPNSFIVQVFFNTKRNEIVEIFREGTSSEKTDVVKICTSLDPANAIKYRTIQRG
jgi:hypothetical protein